MAYDLLSEPIRKYVRDKRWEELHPIQAAAITKILSTEENYILASRTASGKTEAAFLPILSKIDIKRPGVKVLYISPLIALINDQFARVEQLCTYLNLPVTKWHGEANVSAKKQLIKDPNGIVLITPESLEAMFVNKPYQVKQLFGNLQFIVIDEIHSFIGSDRGIQLKSILSRLQSLNTKPFRIIGLSATIGDYTEAKRFTGNEAFTKVLLDRTSKEIEVAFRFFETDTEELPLTLLKNLYAETKDNKVLLFPNSRGRAEEVAVKLKKISEKVGGHRNYFSHHSSVDKEVREYVEYFAKNNQRQNFLISCTSTLELGIDIGSVDEVVQIDATHSIASLIQRVGRSGRRDGEKSYLFLYATNKWSLLQSLACYTLYLDGFIEPPIVNDRAYDILLHQILSITKGHSGIALDELQKQLEENFAFSGISKKEIKEIIEHLIEIDFLEKIQHEVIIGIEGEKIVNHRDFFSVFKTEENFKVINQGNTIGEVPFSLQIIEGENILLAARMWKIIHVDEKSKKIEVAKANDGKKPIFFGSGVNVHSSIRQRMLELLFQKDRYDMLEDTAADGLDQLRSEFKPYPLQNLITDRPLFIGENHLEFYSFTGTRINRTLQFLFSKAGLKSISDERSSMFELDGTYDDFLKTWSVLADSFDDIDRHLKNLLLANPSVFDFSKWGVYLALKYKLLLLKNRYFDIPGTLNFIQSIKIIPNR